MKLTIACMLFACLHVAANGFSQEKVTLKLHNTEIKQALFAIEKNSAYRFLFSDKILRGKPSISIDVKNAGINDVLKKIFEGKGISYQVMSTNLIVLKPNKPGTEAVTEKPIKEITVTGKVTGETGEVLEGVSVSIKGTSIGTTTNAEGIYSLRVPEEAVLVFTFIGYNVKEETVNSRNIINVVLQQIDATLEQVVVVGYGTQRKRDLTGSIVSVSGDEVAKAPNTNPMASLQGKVPGLTIANVGEAGASPTVRIRGVSSTNNATPLYIVDGVMHDNIDFLNPADIETIDVLKDPSSIAIFGLRGGRGVIAITLKKAARGKTTVNFQSMVGIQKVQDKIKMVDADGFKKLYNAQLENLGADDFDYDNYTANTNWQDLVLRDAMINTNSLTISNSGEKTTTNFTIGYNNQDGVMKYNNYQKYIARLTQEVRINDNIKVGGEVNAFHWRQKPQTSSITNALWAAPIVPVNDGDAYYSMPSFQRAQVGNPIASMERNRNTDINQGYRVIGSAFAEIKFLRSFTWKSSVYADLGFNSSRSYNPLPYTFINLGEGQAPTERTYDNTVKTSVSQNQAEYKNFQQDHVLTYENRFGDHRFTAMAGFTTLYNSSVNLSGNRRDTTLNVPNDPNYWYLGVINAGNPLSNGGGGSKGTMIGAFGRINYAFANKYLVNASIRRDGSSAIAPQNRYETFGSVGLGWVASDEDFMTGVTFIDYLKVRGSIGTVGNASGIAQNLYLPGLNTTSNAVFGDNVYTAVGPAYIPARDLRWESVRGIDVAVEFRTLKNKLSGDITFYDRDTRNIITSFLVPSIGQTMRANLGTINNKGIEVSASWNDVINEDMSYGVSANFSYNKNNVSSIGDSFDFALFGNGNANRTISGYSVGHFWGYKQVGIYQTTADLSKMPAFGNSLPGDIAYADADGDGTLTPADRVYLGTPFPPYSFGASFNFKYKNIDLLVEGQGVAGNKIYTQRRIANFAVLNYEANRLNAWTGAGTTNVEPIVDNSRGNNYLFSSYYLEPGDYFRIRTLQVGYTFHRSFLDRVGAQSARIFANGQNIVNWSRVTGYSPEAQISNILGGGADNGTYPVPAVYSLGINITF